MEAAAPGRRGDPAAHTCRRRRSPRRSSSTTPFPPDDRSVGYERGTSVSKAWDQATTDAAIEVAGYVADASRRAGRASAKGGAIARSGSASSAGEFAERAFRRPLDRRAAGALRRPPVRGGRRPGDGRQAGRAARPQVAPVPLPRARRATARRLRRGVADLVRALGFAPRPGAAGRRGGRASSPTASRWPARPSGWSTTCGRVPSSASSSSSGSRSTRSPTSPRTPSSSPASTQAIASDLRTSLDLFLEDVVWGESSDFRQLLLADDLYLNGRLAKFYGADLPPDAPFQKVSLEPERAGRDPVAPVPDGDVRLHVDDLADPSRRVPRPERAGPFAPAAARGRVAAAARPAPGLTTRERVVLQTQPDVVHHLPRDDQPAGVPAGELRRRRPVPERGARASRSTPRGPTRPARARR